MSKIDVQILNLVKKELAMHYRIVPFQLQGEVLSIYVSGNSVISEELELLLDKKIVLNRIETEDLERLLAVNYLSNEERAKQSYGKAANSGGHDFVDEVVLNAIASNSSDIHIEVYEGKARVRYRIDGVLVERYIIPMEEYSSVVNRIKVRANLDIAEKRLPQDGRVNFRSEDNSIDIRVSILPTFYGEKAVLRLLRTDNMNYELNNLGMTDEEKTKFLTSIQKPNGIVLISGPTGSGKTTTLYTSLKLLNSKTKNILTIENPIEYTIAGINQVQINDEIGLSFAAALRSFLRQDPDIIMIGEIRDRETAEMAIRASLTGHLVLSTIHTNSAIGTISRLQDMEIPSFLLAETINISIAQRLIRRLCPSCKKPVQTSTELKEKYKFETDTTHLHYRPDGCNQCLHTGYKGRIAIYDMLVNDSNLQEFIKKGIHHPELGQNGLRKRAVELFTEGITSLEEIVPYLI